MIFKLFYKRSFDTDVLKSPPCFCSRDEVKTKWSVSDFIKAFIKFHGHVYLSKSLEKLDGLREKLEEQFQVKHTGHPASLLSALPDVCC